MEDKKSIKLFELKNFIEATVVKFSKREPPVQNVHSKLSNSNAITQVQIYR